MVINNGQIIRYRTCTYRISRDSELKTIDQAVDFVNQRGFIFFWPIKDVVLPSLWAATAGDRPVLDNHDDPGHITWGWKDDLLGKRRWYYARILRRRNTIISLDIAPYFYALSPNYGNHEEDYLEQYRNGLLTQEAKSIYEALLKEGPLDTLALRKSARLSSKESQSRFNRALDDLQIEFKLLPSGISQSGAWHYAFIYDIVPRHFPYLAETARHISIKEAREKLLELYLLSAGAVQLKDITRLFGWCPEECLATAESLEKEGKIINEVVLEGSPGIWMITPKLVGAAS